MKQISLATAGFEVVTMRTRKREFLDDMNLVCKRPANSVLVSPCEHSRINSRCGGGYADYP